MTIQVDRKLQLTHKTFTVSGSTLKPTAFTLTIMALSGDLKKLYESSGCFRKKVLFMETG